MINLVGEAKPITRAGFEEALSIVGCNEAQLRTIIEVEALSCGFLQSKLLVILYERHIFYKQTNGKYSIGYEDISSKQSTPAGKYGSNEYQYTKLFKAATLNEHAALKSCSWGIGQILWIVRKQRKHFIVRLQIKLVIRELKTLLVRKFSASTATQQPHPTKPRNDQPNPQKQDAANKLYRQQTRQEHQTEANVASQNL